MKLTGLRVERIDGVDEPATGRKWLVVKSADGDQPDPIRDAAVKALSLLAENPLPAETVAALAAFAAAAGVEQEFKTAEPPAEPEPAPEPAEAPDVEKAVADAIEKALPTLLPAVLQKMLDAELADAQPAESRQETEQDGPVSKTRPKLGEGLFNNVFGR